LLQLNRKKLISNLIILGFIPITIIFGATLLDGKGFYLISLLIIVYSMLPFFLIFEKSKPQARKVVLIAVLSAIAVAGRMAFFMIPQFKPVVAIVIIAGVCLGAESGFLVGAITGFASNFFFGQGPLTPWQMFCFGIIGFLVGVLFSKGFLSTKKIPICIFGGLSTLIIYGGIIDFAALLTISPEISVERLIATYSAGFIFNVVHALATVFFLYFISQTMIEKINRIKTKYGI
jgi:energy-coupling factor transport system substrate-specific component